jgi:hypothetical protein
MPDDAAGREKRASRFFQGRRKDENSVLAQTFAAATPGL